MNALTHDFIPSDRIEIHVDALSGNRSVNIPDYGPVHAAVLVQGASRFGPEEFWVKTWDAAAGIGSDIGQDARRGFATREEAEATADAWLTRSYRLLARRVEIAASLEKVA